MSFIPRQYSWDYRHEQLSMSVENNMLHLLEKNSGFKLYLKEISTTIN